MDPTIIKRLRLTKYQYNLGKNELAKNTEIGAWEAVRAFYDGLETFMVTLAANKRLDIRKIQYSEYPGRIAKAYDTIVTASSPDA